MSIVITELQEGWKEGEIVVYHEQEYIVVETAEFDDFKIVAVLEPVEDED
jgi:hypothetical protein